jgi:hypothetical protein
VTRLAKLGALMIAAMGCLAAGCDDDDASTGPSTGPDRDGLATVGTPLAGISPCTLFSAADLPDHLYQSYEPQLITSGDLRICETPQYAITIDDSTGRAHDSAFSGPRAQAIPDIAGRRSVRDTSSPVDTSCEISMEVTATELVSVTIFSEDQEVACGSADRAAAIVAKRLP